MKKSFFPFLFTAIFMLLNFAGFVAEANSFLNGAPTLLNEIHALPNERAKERTLAPGVKIKVGGEARYRLELRSNLNLNDATYEDDAVNLFRTRLNLTVSLGSNVVLFAEGQDAESVAESKLNRTSAFVNHLDLRQLYADVKSPLEKLPLHVKVGRQVLSYGDQRFVGGFDWSNVSRVFDAVKVSYPITKAFQADLWFSQVVPVNRGKADSADHNDNFYGLYTTLKPLKEHILDSFLFVRNNLNNEIVGERPGERGQLKEYTLGNRFKGKEFNFDYGIEWAWQFGSRAHDDIRAWAWHNEIGYTFNLPWNPRPNFEFNHGSGDSNPQDGHYGNFDNLFPTNHIHYGYIDLASLRNINNFKIGVGIKPLANLDCSTDYHWFFLDTNKSAWFNASQAVIRSASPGASRFLGHELDLLAKWKISERLDFLTGYSIFFAGTFADDTGASDTAHFFYVQPTYKF